VEVFRAGVVIPLARAQARTGTNIEDLLPEASLHPGGLELSQSLNAIRDLAEDFLHLDWIDWLFEE